MIKQINIIIYIFRNKHNNLVNKSRCQCQKKIIINIIPRRKENFQNSQFESLLKIS